MAYDLVLNTEKVEQIRNMARDRGISEDEMIAEIVQKFLCKTGEITRFAAKKGPRNGARQNY